MKNKWFVAIKKRWGDMYDLSDLTVIEAPGNRYIADPFLVEDGEKTYLFFEEYDYEKGKISFGEIVESNGVPALSHPRTAIVEPWHMSFPSVQKFGANFYMTPERCLAGSLWIYKATRFPDIWTQHRLVATGRFDDPIIRKVDDGYQVWATEENKLVVWQAGSLDSENWRVVKREDKPFMRNAGLFIGDIRPTQDCVPTYGRAIKFLDGDNVVHEIEPTWHNNLTGTHTFNVSSKYVVIDGRIKLE